ncbi:hypothetical protein N665_0157s0096 [Sinapis alba]|nr:hypothetical protein N665_0157s0096 [Sinapis alba]
MLRSRTNPLSCLKKKQSERSSKNTIKKQSEIDRERDSGRCLPLFQLIPFSKNQNLGWVVVLPLTC